MNEANRRIKFAYNLDGWMYESGTGLCIENIGWGEFSLLPVNYTYLLL